MVVFEGEKEAVGTGLLDGRIQMNSSTVKSLGIGAVIRRDDRVRRKKLICNCVDISVALLQVLTIRRL